MEETPLNGAAPHSLFPSSSRSESGKTRMVVAPKVLRMPKPPVGRSQSAPVRPCGWNIQSIGIGTSAR